MVSSFKTIRIIPLNNIKIQDKFWAPRIRNNHKITIPYVFNQCEKTGRIDNFLRASGALKDGKRPIFPFDDSDVFKAIEGTAYSLIHYPDSKLEEYVDDVIEKIANAQEKDGYLYTTRTINPNNPHIWAGKDRWDLVSIFSHELYNIGHLIEAGIAYHQFTGRKLLLNIAIKCADLVEKEFGSNKIERFPGHQEIELALIKLYKHTMNTKYLDLAKFFLDIRGANEVLEFKQYLTKFNSVFPFPSAKNLKYNQTHKKITEQEEAVGHAVRATYMYSAMTDIIGLLHDKEYETSINQLWENIIFKKLYITGGIGARKFVYGEGFGNNYSLPNFDTYCETCAVIGNIIWNHRLFLIYGDAKYIDILERSLYNAFLAGVSLDGKMFFYSNQLASKGKVYRKPWYKVPCCPTNIIRFFPQIPSFIYGVDEDNIFINLFMDNIADIFLNNDEITLSQETKYPWDGYVKLIINILKEKEFCISIRIPGWARNKPVPSDLYSYLKKTSYESIIKINDKKIDFQIENGYVKIKRVWKDNDIIELDIPMPIKRVLSHIKVESNIGKVAIERGPFVYCIESLEEDNNSIFDFELSDNDELKPEFQADLLGGIVLISGKQKFIPYYSWANRGKSKMRLWIPRENPIS